MGWKHSIVKALGFNVVGEKQKRQAPQKSGPAQQVLTNDFPFESNLGLFLDKGFEAFTAEGERQGYDDPTTENWEKQVQLLKVQFDNNLKRELFIKENKFSILKEVLDSTDGIVSSDIEFIADLKRAENELTYLREQIALVEGESGWYLMLHEALHDGFQDGSKKKINELKTLNGL